MNVCCNKEPSGSPACTQCHSGTVDDREALRPTDASTSDYFCELRTGNWQLRTPPPFAIIIVQG